MRRFSLRAILAASLVLSATVPALLVLWTMTRSSSQAVQDLAGKLLTEVAVLVQTGTEAHVRQAHDVLDGLFAEPLAAGEVGRARAWLRDPSQFEAMAFALTRQSADVPVLHFGNLKGGYFGVEATAT
ncbi:MAG: histidine kinase, partial [Ramlibacter sp.]